MSILSPLSSVALARHKLAELLESEIAQEPYLHLLRWLIWFPLLSVEELTRLEQARLAKQERTRSPQRVAAQLQTLEDSQLISHLIVNEPGWRQRQHRYFLTDAGIYVFAGRADPPLSVPKLAQAYAVERADLIDRIASIERHLVLAEISTRFIAEGSTQGYTLTSFQQPWRQSDIVFGQQQVWSCDAAFLLADSQGTEYAFYMRVDTNRRCPLDTKRERLLLSRLLNLRRALHLHHETLPPLLIITRATHLPLWSSLLERTGEHHGTSLLDGAITTLEYLQSSGIYETIWWPLTELIHGVYNDNLIQLAAPTVSLSNLMDTPASPALAERFSQRRNFAHLHTKQLNGPFRTTSRPLPAYVGKPLPHEIATLRASTLADALSGTKEEQQEATSLLNLALSTTQKELLFWLTHHPLLTLHHLARLHSPEGQDTRSVQRQMEGLSALNLLVPFQWYGSRPWHERERYVLAEAALRYSALREGKQAIHYLLSEEKARQRKALALSIQQGTAGLFAQMEHTHGLYHCMVLLLAAAQRENTRIITWKSAREALRWYRDPFTHVPMQIRPDAEVIYHMEGQHSPQSILVEYDRATTTEREYEAKYQSYTDYQDVTHLKLPPILVITRHEQAAALIRACINTVGTHLSVIIVLQEQLEHQGLLALLAQSDPS